MRALEKRLQALEVGSGIAGGWDMSRPTHLIRVEHSQPYCQAVEAYRLQNPDKEIDGRDNVMWLQFVDVNWSEDGRIIPPIKDEREPPSLAEAMAGGV